MEEMIGRSGSEKEGDTRGEGKEEVKKERKMINDGGKEAEEAEEMQEKEI